jgi:hypothetical protein
LCGGKKGSRTGSEESVLLEHENQNIRKPVVRGRKGQKSGKVRVRGQIAEVNPAKRF